MGIGHLDGADESGSTRGGLLTLKGILVPVDWDDNGRVVAVALSTYDEQEYLIAPNNKGKELQAFLREEVEVHGIVKADRKGKTLKVKDYTINPGGAGTDTI